MAANLNKVFLMGNLTRDPELRYTASGAAVCSIGMAINRRYRNNDEWKEEVCFVDVVAWGKTGENCSQYLTKGSAVLVEGRLKLNTWEQEGQKRSKLEVVAENIQFMASRDSSGHADNPGTDEETIPF